MPLDAYDKENLGYLTREGRAAELIEEACQLSGNGDHGGAMRLYARVQRMVGHDEAFVLAEQSRLPLFPAPSIETVERRPRMGFAS